MSKIETEEIVTHHHYIPGHPDSFGPGTWWILHLKSYNVDSTEKIEEFMDFLHLIIYNIPCLKCRGHAIEYIKSNDGSKYKYKYYNNRFVGMFIFISDFHNTVNKRKGKNIVNWELAFKEYDDNFNDQNNQKINKFKHTENKIAMDMYGYVYPFNKMIK